MDQNTNVSRLEIGPKTFVKQDESVIFGPEKMITIHPRHYCVIENPVIKIKEGRIEYDNIGQAKLLFAVHEIRFNQEPFPLFPGEVLKKNHTLSNCSSKFSASFKSNIRFY